MKSRNEIAFRIALTICLFHSVSVVQLIWAQNSTNVLSERQRRLQLFEGMVGEWSVESGEKASDGEFFTESGTRKCEWTLNKTAIRCEDDLTIDKSSPRYKRLGTKRNFVRYLIFNDETTKYEVWFMSSRSTRVSSVSLVHSPNDNSLSNVSTFELSWLKEKVENRTRRWFVGENEMRERADIKSLSSDFSEVFEMVFRRLSNAK